MRSNSRQRMLQSAAMLFREQGLSGTGLRDVVDHSGAPRGSIYHHFPHGKAQLAEETVRYVGNSYVAALQLAGWSADPVAGLKTTLGWWKETLEATGFHAGCPIVAVAAEAHHEAPELSLAAAGAFEAWEEVVAGALEEHGVEKAQAQRLATLYFAAMEGAIVLCRARRSTQPLDEVARELEAAIRAALG
jgi:AcrR family transcriptional regulator